VEIPSSVTKIGESAFSECTSLKQFIVDDDNPNYCDIDGVLYSKDRKTLISVPRSFNENFTVLNGVTEIRVYAFSGCLSLTSVKIPEGVTEIGDYVFSECTSLTSVEIPSSVTKIGGCAFWNCTNLASFEIPSSVTKIGWDAFEGCTNLTSVTIPSSVTKIGGQVFKGCTSLTELHCRHKKPLDALSECFEDVDVSKITLYVPIGCGYDYRHHPFYSQFKEVVIEK
jgi:hypothetical protein